MWKTTKCNGILLTLSKQDLLHFKVQFH